MVDAALVLAFATSVIVYLWIYRWRQRNQLGPKTWPYFGNLLELRANAARFHDWTYDYMSKSPTATIDVYFRHHRGIMVGRPDIVEHILKTRFNNYIKGPILAERLGDLLGNGIFNADGDVWKQHRKLASFEFSSMKLREVSTEAYREHALRLLTFLDTVADSHKQVDIQDLFLRMTMDSICKVGFGVDQRNLNLDLPEIKFAKAFDALSEWSTARNFDTTWKLKRRFNIGREKLFRALLPDVDSFTYSVIQDRREEITRLESMNQTLVSQLFTLEECTRSLPWSISRYGMRRPHVGCVVQILAIKSNILSDVSQISDPVEVAHQGVSMDCFYREETEGVCIPFSVFTGIWPYG